MEKEREVSRCGDTWGAEQEGPTAVNPCLPQSTLKKRALIKFSSCLLSFSLPVATFLQLKEIPAVRLSWPVLGLKQSCEDQ